MQTQLADEHAKMSELQDQLNDLQQRCDASAEVVQHINASPYWKTKEELEKLVQAQREHVFLTVSQVGLSSLFSHIVSNNYVPDQKDCGAVSGCWPCFSLWFKNYLLDK